MSQTKVSGQSPSVRERFKKKTHTHTYCTYIRVILTRSSFGIAALCLVPCQSTLLAGGCSIHLSHSLPAWLPNTAITLPETILEVDGMAPEKTHVPSTSTAVVHETMFVGGHSTVEAWRAFPSRTSWQRQSCTNWEPQGTTNSASSILEPLFVRSEPCVLHDLYGH